MVHLPSLPLQVMSLPQPAAKTYLRNTRLFVTSLRLRRRQSRASRRTGKIKGRLGHSRIRVVMPAYVHDQFKVRVLLFHAPPIQPTQHQTPVLTEAESRCQTHGDLPTLSHLHRHVLLRLPYALLDGIVSVRFSFKHMPARPSSQPLITCPPPTITHSQPSGLHI